MITIEELLEQQRKFDEKHESNFRWDVKITEDNIATLEFLLICLVGEFGETANIIKKIIRGDKKLEEAKEQLSEEVTDMLIYILKLAYQLDIDIENTFKKKLQLNYDRFSKFEKNKNE